MQPLTETAAPSALAPDRPPSLDRPPARETRILFSLLHPGYLRHYREPIRLLAERGHHVHVALGRWEKDPGDLRLMEELAATSENITYGLAPSRPRVDGWRRIGWLVRALTDVSRYAHPRYAGTPALRGRMAEKLHWRLDYSRAPKVVKPPLHRFIERMCSGADAPLAERMERLLARLEEAIPTAPQIDEFVREQQPDLLVASPVIEFASAQVEYLKSAARQGVATAIAVASWDNLTGKGLLRFLPDRVLVWNEIQRGELEEMHGIPPDRVVLTGAQRFDWWFGREPTLGYSDFARKVSVDPGKPYLLYLCSSPFIAPDEVSFVRRWVEALREAGDPDVRDLGVLVRPHPQNGKQWDGVDLGAYGNATIWPRAGQQPDAGEARADYFDSLFHCAAVVGINTSALLEAGILGKSVYTVLDPHFETQEGTLHFRYLLRENGGLLHVARSPEEHTEQLARGLADSAEQEQTRNFVRSFLRPYGFEFAAAPVVAAALEDVAVQGAAHRRRTRTSALVLRALLTPVAASITTTATLARRLRLTKARSEPVED